MISYLIEILSNDTLSFLDNFILWVNLFGALYAAYYCFRASKEGVESFRVTFLSISGLAFIYSVAYLYLLLGDPNFLLWSTWMRGVSILVWPLVWAGPAILSIKLKSGQKQIIKKHIKKEIVEEIKKTVVEEVGGVE